MNMQFCFNKIFYSVFIGGIAIIICTLVFNENLMANDEKIAKQTEISLDTAVNKVRRVYRGGKVINTKVESTANGKVFVIKLISADSRVMHILVDAHSGQIHK